MLKFREKILIGLLLFWFLLQTLFLASHVHFGIPPDELHHINVSGYYKDAPGFVIYNTPSSYVYGTISTASVPYFYHLVTGKLLWLNFTGKSDVFLLRILSISFALLFLISILEILDELKANFKVKILSLIIATNIPMFVFIASSASYDNFINLLAARLHLYLIRTFKTNSLDDLLIAILYLLVASLSKISALPFYPIVFIIFIVYFKKTLLILSKLFKEDLTRKAKFLLPMVILFLVLNIILYGSNLLKYGEFLPSTVKVIGSENAQSYQQHRIQEEMALEAENIKLMPFSEFAGKYMTALNASIYGIFAHKSFNYPEEVLNDFYNITWPFDILALVALIMLLIYRKKILSIESPYYLLLGFSAFFYYSYLLYHNYQIYLSYHMFGVSLQGRYLFPVLANIIIIFSSISLFKMKGALGWLIIIFCGYFCFRYGFIYILPNLDSRWLMSSRLTSY